MPCIYFYLFTYTYLLIDTVINKQAYENMKNKSKKSCSTWYGKCATVEKATMGFVVIGIWPYRRDIFYDEDSEASRIAEFNSASNTAVAAASEVSPPSSTADQVSAVPPEVPPAGLNSEVQGSLA